MIYISGAITGTSDYMERFKKAQDTLESKGYTVINPALVNSNLPEKCSHDDYMTVSMALLSLCSTIYLLEGWNHSAGAKEEVAWAIEHGLLILTEPTFIEDDELPNISDKKFVGKIEIPNKKPIGTVGVIDKSLADALKATGLFNDELKMLKEINDNLINQKGCEEKHE